MKVALTIQLQQDDGTPVVTGTQTKSTFTSGDYGLVMGFLTGYPLSTFVKMMGWIADGRVTLSGTPTVTLNQL